MKKHYVMIVYRGNIMYLPFTLKTLNVSIYPDTPSDCCYFVKNGQDVLDVVASELNISKDKLEGKLTVPLSVKDNTVLHVYEMSESEAKKVNAFLQSILREHTLPRVVSISNVSRLDICELKHVKRMGTSVTINMHYSPNKDTMHTKRYALMLSDTKVLYSYDIDYLDALVSGEISVEKFLSIQIAVAIEQLYTNTNLKKIAYGEEKIYVNLDYRNNTLYIGITASFGHDDPKLIDGLQTSVTSEVNK